MVNKYLVGGAITIEIEWYVVLYVVLDVYSKKNGDWNRKSRARMVHNVDHLQIKFWMAMMGAFWDSKPRSPLSTFG